MTDNYKGYSLFNGTENVALRAWNRCATFVTIMQDHGKTMAESYVKQLDDIARKQMNNMLDDIKRRGYGTVRREITEGCKVH